MLPQSINESLVKKQKECKECPYENHIRRFFDTTISNLYWNSQTKENFLSSSSIDKLMTLMRLNPAYFWLMPEKIDKINTAKVIISHIRMFSFDTQHILKKEIEIRNKSCLSPTKDRGLPSNLTYSLEYYQKANELEERVLHIKSIKNDSFEYSVICPYSNEIKHGKISFNDVGLDLNSPVNIEQLEKVKEAILKITTKRHHTISNPEISMHKGIIKSHIPVPKDMCLEEITNYSLTNVFREIDKNIENGFSINNPHVPYVNSLSGTTYSMVAMMSEYMNLFKKDPKLETNVNEIIKAYVSFTCLSGFHSLGEMQAVFADNIVQELFNEYGVQLEDFFPEEIVNEAINKAIEYHNTLINRKEIHKEILNNGYFSHKKTIIAQQKIQNGSSRLCVEKAPLN